MKVLGICGSLRAGSYNRLLLAAAAEIARSKDVELSIFNLDSIPFYNFDLDGPDKPEPVQQFIDAIDAAAGLVFAVPEYNHSISGVLKNAIDWASRPAFKSGLANKPSAVLSAAESPLGGVRGQMNLRTILDSTLTPVYLTNDYLLPMAHEAFDDQGVLRDETGRTRLERYIHGYCEWIKGYRQVV